ncbi:MAG: DUF899 family protein [Agarilytica sp.]
MSESSISFPNETALYREAREALLEKEKALRAQIEAVNEARRALPLGGRIPEDYEFRQVSDDSVITFSELFSEGKDTLVLYSFMFAPDASQPCASCNSLADSFDGNALHLEDRVNFYIVSKAPVMKMRAWAESRAWRNLKILSSSFNYYNRDYRGENAEGFQMPIINVFVKRDGEIYHSYASELLFNTFELGEPRHVDMLWPLWNVLDLTPQGRGKDWHPKLEYPVPQEK